MKTVVAGPNLLESLPDRLIIRDPEDRARFEALFTGAMAEIAADLPFRLAIESTTGQEVTGRLLCGRLAVGDEIMFSPSHLTARGIDLE